MFGRGCLLCWHKVAARGITARGPFAVSLRYDRVFHTHEEGQYYSVVSLGSRSIILHGQCPCIATPVIKASIYSRSPHELYRYAAITPPQPPALSLCFAIAWLPSSTMFVTLFEFVP